MPLLVTHFTPVAQELPTTGGVLVTHFTPVAQESATTGGGLVSPSTSSGICVSLVVLIMGFHGLVRKDLIPGLPAHGYVTAQDTI